MDLSLEMDCFKVIEIKASAWCAGGASGTQTQLIGAQNVPYYPKQWCVVNPNKDLSTLPANIEYACAHADCTPLDSGGSCSGLTLVQNASYAFNTYYQFNNQLPSSCDFTGLAQVVTTDPSVGTCEFLIGVKPVADPPPGTTSAAASAASLEADLRVWANFGVAIIVTSCLLLS